MKVPCNVRKAIRKATLAAGIVKRKEGCFRKQFLLVNIGTSEKVDDGN